MSKAITCLDDIFEFTVSKNDIAHGTERREHLRQIILSIPVNHIMIELRLLFRRRPPAQQKGVQ
jgi:hypothetical protein